MDDRSGDITVRRIEDAESEERAGQLIALLAVGIERWLRGEVRVDDGRDVSVYPDVQPDRPRW